MQYHGIGVWLLPQMINPREQKVDVVLHLFGNFRAVKGFVTDI
jgi:hypothetical protein